MNARGGRRGTASPFVLARGSEDAPLVGFILMIDSFREENGAARFARTSQNWTDLPRDRLSDAGQNTLATS